MKTPARRFAAFLALIPLAALAQEQPIEGDVRVHGSVTLDDPNNHPLLYFKGADAAPTAPGPVGASLSYEDSETGVLISRMNRAQAEWRWQAWTGYDAPDRLQMRLDTANVLTLVDPANSANQIAINPGGAAPGITVNGQRLATLNEIAGSFVPNSYGAITVGSSGNVGIGNANPRVSLFVGPDAGAAIPIATSVAIAGGYNQSPSEFNNRILLLTGTNLDYGAYLGLLNTDGSGTGQVAVIGARGAGIDHNALFVRSNGLVGIGTPSPQALLDITGYNDIYTASFARLTNISVFGQTPLDFYIGGNLRGRVRADYAGNLSMVARGGGFYFLTGGDWAVGGTVRMMIQPDGKVGIGTLTPTDTFHVVGNARVDGRLRIAPQGDVGMGEFTSEPAQ